MMVVFHFGIVASCLLAAMTQNAWQLAGALTLRGAFASIYHPVGIPMLVQHTRRPGAVIGVNGLVGNLGIPAVAPANVRPAAQDQEHGPAPADSHAIARHNMMDFCLYSTVQIKREREAARLMRAHSS
jgi:hypothetical protein